MRDFDTHTFAYENTDGKVRSYHVPDLWEHVKDYEVFECDVECIINCINGYINIFDSGDWDRVLNADLSYPVILNDVSGIADGCHRAVKALFLGITHIKAVRIVDFPEPTNVWGSWKDYDENP